ncbi:hypothetical protein JTE90_028940 [Oedothorax gibbosus]|uniref:Uncharacterized protein n=1 Tax=Oedothorax gibbosus TaxID=931172 RepID=A0AAV6VIL7_9ARAC|nr:hypothetical protein JTE90_028940 [Oedothorax gibbosus]
MSPKHATKDGNLRESGKSPFPLSSCHVLNKLSKKDRKDIEEKLLFPSLKEQKSADAREHDEAGPKTDRFAIKKKI